mmetsp:Transcript_104815/g.291919  ORF Transcript_104815/g.291919 Transcript_104815/m.291919 type:complete len:163 (+) Transcript_104815:139-627(+)
MGSSCSATLSENVRHCVQYQRNDSVEEEQARRGQLSRQLIEASRRGNLEAVRTCLVEGAPANACDEHGWAPLHYSASAGQVDVCRLLLDYKGDANAALPDLSTPLMLAADEAHLNVARLLLEEGALTKCKDEDGFTALSRCDPQYQDEFRYLISASTSEPAG